MKHTTENPAHKPCDGTANNKQCCADKSTANHVNIEDTVGSFGSKVSALEAVEARSTLVPFFFQ